MPPKTAIRRRIHYILMADDLPLGVTERMREVDDTTSDNYHTPDPLTEGAPPVSGCNCDGCKSARTKEDGGEYAPRGEFQTYNQRHGRTWQRQREKALERDQYECASCGMTDEEHRHRDDMFPPDGGLHVHHKTPTRRFESEEEAHKLENLITLCDGCHKEQRTAPLFN